MDQPLFNNLEVDELSGNYFRTAAGWARFISIVYIVCIVGLAAMFALVYDNVQFNEGFNRAMALQQLSLQIGIGVVFGILGIIMLAVLAISYFMLSASNQIRKGIGHQDQAIFNKGLGSLKNGLVLYGILSLVGLVLSLFNLFT